MKILITNRKMTSPWGSELYVRDLATELLRRGHRPMVYTSELGAVADEMINATIAVSDNIGRSFFYFIKTFGKLHATSFSTATGMDLSFDHPPVGSGSFC